MNVYAEFGFKKLTLCVSDVVQKEKLKSFCWSSGIGRFALNEFRDQKQYSVIFQSMDMERGITMQYLMDFIKELRRRFTNCEVSIFLE